MRQRGELKTAANIYNYLYLNIKILWYVLCFTMDQQQDQQVQEAGKVKSRDKKEGAK